ncbi:hypothetical protein EDC04DRAFT_2693637 [Pisolithus marmoratus]|nr:hypothetical protein EDC04DRAFT_2693637 [Pisolithus marmoratus]
MGPPIPRKRRLSSSGDDIFLTNPIRQRLDNTTADGVSPNPIRQQLDNTTTSVSRGLEGQTNGANSESISDMRLSTIQSESMTTRPPRPHLRTRSFGSPSPQQTAAAGDDRCRVEEEREEDGDDVRYASSSSTRGRPASERISLLWREVLEIRRQQVMLRDKEAVLLDEMDKLSGNLRASSSTTSLPTTSSAEMRLAEMETELREERERRTRAEKALEEVERECRSPFVVPALFRAFITISDLSTSP